ncbi:MAG: CHAT domain-containing tetratricopeptide repeat protein [Bacteroidota bacterium]
MPFFKVVSLLVGVILCGCLNGNAQDSEMPDCTNRVQNAIDKAAEIAGQGKYAEAKQILVNTLNQYGGKANAETAALGWHKAGVYDYIIDDYRGSVSSYKNAISLREKVLPENHPDLIKSYFNTGSSYYMMGNSSQAKNFLEGSLKRQSDPPTPLVHNTRLLLGRVYDSTGDIQEAEEYLTAHILNAETRYKDDPVSLAAAYANLAAFYSDKKELAIKTLNYTDKVLNLTNDLKEKDAYTWSLVANAYDYMALAHKTMGDLAKAQEHYSKSLLLNEKHQGPQSGATAFSLNNLAVLALKDGRLSQAREYITKAIAINQERNDNLALAGNYDNLGDILARQNDWQAALRAYHLGTSALTGTIAPENLYEHPDLSEIHIPNKPLLLRLLSSKALCHFNVFQAEYDQQALDASRVIYSDLTSWISELRNEHISQESKIFLADKTKSIFENALNVALAYYDVTKDKAYLEEAFHLAEKSKATILLEAWKASEMINENGLPSDLFDKQQDLKFDITWYKQEKYKYEQSENPDPATLQSLADSIQVLKLRYSGLMDRISVEHPKYFDLINGSQSMDVTDIRKNLLRTGETLIEYVFGEDRITIFVLSKEELHIEQIALHDNLVDMIDSLRVGLFACRMPDAEISCSQGDLMYLDLGHRLYRLLIKPIADRLSEQLIIIPDEAIGYVPFEALLSEKANSDKVNFRMLPYMMREFQISYSYSSALLAAARSMDSNKKGKGILAFAPAFSRVSFGQNDLQKTEGGEGARATLSPLNFNEEEVANIMALAKGAAFTGETAKRNNFFAEASAYNLIHLSSHGYVNDEDPRYSFIAFSQTDNTLNFDELLFVSDLYNLKLNADMVVLSACNTGFGKLNKGEGIMSLARAFTYAGAKSIVTSLWSVNDRNTAKLMSHFYQNLKAGYPKDRALQQAKLSMADAPGSGHPFYWAGFISIGNMEPVDLRQGFNWLLMIPVSLAFALIWLFLIRRTRT